MRRLKDIHLYHSVRVDVQENYFKDGNYTIEMTSGSDFREVKITHNVSGKSRYTNFSNIISYDYLEAEKISAKAKLAKA
jgi:hypothetical protein